jgi:hypothetical protein
MYVEKLHAVILTGKLKGFKKTGIERAEGPTASHDLRSQLLYVCQSACLCLVFSLRMIHLQNRQRAGN